MSLFTSILLHLLAALSVLYVYAVFREKGIRLFHSLLNVLKEKTLSERIFLNVFFLAMVGVICAKPGGNTNGSSYNLPKPSAGDTSPSLTPEDFARGFVLTRIGTNEVHDFSPSGNAVVNSNWLTFGAAEDWTYLSFDDWAFPFVSNEVNKLRVCSFGKVSPFPLSANVFFAPFLTSLGIVPEVNWSRIVFNAEAQSRGDTQSCFWHCLTPSNTLLLTWQNALYNRATNTPVSIQVEISPEGSFVYRYDLSSIRMKIQSGEWPENWASNIAIGASNEENGQVLGAKIASSNLCETLRLCDSALKNGTLTSLAFQRLEADDCSGSDRDNDGLTIEDEIFVYHTDPYRADSDHDALSDFEEVYIYNSNPLDPYSLGGEYYDGLIAKSGNSDIFSCPPNSTNTVLEHIFYSGASNGTINYPQSSESMAVLTVSVSGSGSGRLLVGDTVVPLIAANDTGTTLLVGVAKDTTHKLAFWGENSLHVDLTSDDFAFGEISLDPSRTDAGYVYFPNPIVPVACIHNFNARKTGVYLPAGKGAELLSATWHGNSGVQAENKPPRGAEITGSFSIRETRSIGYVLSHPKYLFGKTTYTQNVRFCPRPVNDDQDGNAGDTSDDPFWYTSSEPGKAGEYEEGEGEEYQEVWCCYFKACDEWCMCGCESDCESDCGCDCESDDDEDDSSNQMPNFNEICPRHSHSYEECASSHEEEYATSKNAFPHLGGVLHIRESPQYENIRLDVPAEHRNCCPCPEHWTNYVGLAYKSYRLRLLDENGNKFSRSENSCDVKLAGIHPSSAIGDATLVFSRNGEIYRQYDKTVLGVAIKGEYGEDLSVYNALNVNFGCPITVNTNIVFGKQMHLAANVKLPSGNIHLGLADTTGQFTVWYYDNSVGGYRKLLDSETMKVKNLDLAYWHTIMRRSTDCSSPNLPVLVTSSAPGKTKLVFRYWAVIDGKFVEDTAFQYITSLKPPLRLDMTGDGAIDDEDMDALFRDAYFRYWVNEDTVKGDYAGAIEDNTPNKNDFAVNGTYDLVNFFPVAMDFKPFGDAWGDRVQYIIKGGWNQSPSFNFCFVDLPWSQAGSIQTANVMTTSGTPLASSGLRPLSRVGTEITRDFFSRFSTNSGLMVCEALEQAQDIYVEIKLDGKLLYSYNLPMRISSVRNMYRWLNLRSLAGDNVGETSRLSNPFNNPDGECDGKHFVFVHGYNVSPSGARSWADQMFKRLWLSGARSRFTAVDWKGDESQVYIPTQGDVSPNYYINVRNAFMTAQEAANQINALGGEKIMIAHSLGNILVSSAIKDHGLAYSKYYMLNAALPMEAYDTEADMSEMVDSEWRNVPLSYRASDWSILFPANDFRSSLSWRGRFAGIANAINCYSPTEDVLANPEEGQLTLVGGAWKIQELTKGTTLWNELNALPFLGLNVACEGGWGINTYYALNPLWYVYQYGFTDKVGTDLAREEAIIHPLFTPFRSESEAMHSTNLFAIADATYRNELRAKFLADAIPATSFAAGANHTGGLKDNYNMSSQIPNGWPPQREKNTSAGVVRQWFHSDIKDIAFFYVYKLFEKIIKEER